MDGLEDDAGSALGPDRQTSAAVRRVTGRTQAHRQASAGLSGGGRSSEPGRAGGAGERGPQTLVILDVETRPGGYLYCEFATSGEMSEWLKEHAWRACRR